jgi:P-type Ca2+ transporter type 2C
MANPPPRGAARPEVFPASAMPWHALASEEVAELLGTDPESGLARVAADHRRALVGANRVGEARETPVWRLALDQFRSLVVLLLLAAASIAALLGERAEALAILAALLLNAVIGFGTEWRARISLARLRALAVPQAVVRRDRVSKVPAAELVPGDVVLEPGAQVPADGRLVRSTALEVNEAALTGESAPVGKTAHVELETPTPLAERTNIVYLGTGVLAGTAAAMAIVTATGLATELGRIGQLVALAGERTTPLEQQVEELGRRLPNPTS